MKTVRIFSDRIRDRICLEGFRSVRIRVRIFNIRNCIRIRILKSHIYDVDIQLYHIRHDWHYPYSNLNPTKNIKINIISVISVRIRSVFMTPYTAMASTGRSRVHGRAGSSVGVGVWHRASLLFETSCQGEINRLMNTVVKCLIFSRTQQEIPAPAGLSGYLQVASPTSVSKKIA
jgi:hypothetical protein